jgi:hypothetical protein
MRQSGADIQALRPLRGRADARAWTPTPPRRGPTATGDDKEQAAALDDTNATDKQGSKLVRWAAIEACQHTRAGTKLSADRSRIIAARGRNVGIVAAARRLLTLVFYGLRDGEIRTLAARAG